MICRYYAAKLQMVACRMDVFDQNEQNKIFLKK